MRGFFERNESIINLCWGFCFCTQKLRTEGRAGRDAGGSLASGEEANDTNIYSLVSVSLWHWLDPVPAGSL